jgi:NAD(P)-dependent dehydrogenase (short-subunit alcohol dehydrogenase family)
MDLYLGGKITVVTGASKGIGWAITQALVDEGATVVAGARSSSTGLRTLETTAAFSAKPAVAAAGIVGPAYAVLPLAARRLSTVGQSC